MLRPIVLRGLKVAVSTKASIVITSKVYVHCKLLPIQGTLVPIEV